MTSTVKVQVRAADPSEVSCISTFLLVCNINRRQLVSLGNGHPPSEVLVRAPILAALSRRYSVSSLVRALCRLRAHVGGSGVG